MSDMWTAPDDDPRSYSNPIGEKATYREYLGNYRLTIEMKCEGLDAGQLAQRSVPPSTLSLLGLVRHLGDGTVSTRDVLVHVIEEYARHAGHADLLRESIDGRTGQ
jgi:Protein of unknown function (DUF664)